MKRSAVRLKLSDLLAEASAFTRHAWLSALAPIGLLTLAHTILFLTSHVPPAAWRPGAAPIVAWLAMILYVPLFGSLYRAAIGGRAGDLRGVGGLQWGAVEWRLIVVGAVILALTACAVIPALAVCGVLALKLGTESAVDLGPLGAVSLFKLSAAGVGVGVFLLMAPQIAKLMLGWPYSTARHKTAPFAGLGPARRSGWPIMAGLILAWVPLLIGQLAIYAGSLALAGAIEPATWTLPQAAGAGALLGLIHTALVAPLSVGVLAGAYHLFQDRAEAATSDQHEAHAAAATVAEAAAAAAATAAAAVERHPAPSVHPLAPANDEAPADIRAHAVAHVGEDARVVENRTAPRIAPEPKLVSADSDQVAREAAELDLPPSEIANWYAADVHPAEVLEAVANAWATPEPVIAATSTPATPDTAATATGPKMEAARHHFGAMSETAGGETSGGETSGDARPRETDTGPLKAMEIRDTGSQTTPDVHAAGLGLAAVAVAAAASAHAGETYRVEPVRVPDATAPAAAPTAAAPEPAELENFYPFMEPGAATPAAELATPPPAPVVQAVSLASPKPLGAVDDPHDPHEPSAYGVQTVFDALSPWPHSVLPPWPRRPDAVPPDRDSKPTADMPIRVQAVAEAQQGETYPSFAKVGAPDPRMAEITGLI